MSARHEAMLTMESRKIFKWDSIPRGHCDGLKDSLLSLFVECFLMMQRSVRPHDAVLQSQPRVTESSQAAMLLNSIREVPVLSLRRNEVCFSDDVVNVERERKMLWCPKHVSSLFFYYVVAPCWIASHSFV
jgi:hypothetical protein